MPKGTHLDVIRDLQKRRVRHCERGDCVLKGEVEASACAVAVASDADLGHPALLEGSEHLADAGLGEVDAVAAEPDADVERRAGLEGGDGRALLEELGRDGLQAVAGEVIDEKLIGADRRWA